jgi:hypothetical protein
VRSEGKTVLTRSIAPAVSSADACFNSLGLLICLAGLRAKPAHADSLHDHEHPRVLIVHSYHQGLPWNDGLQKGILSHLGEHTDAP